mmetsp:Transcript_28899/g.21520  ORF Transcript_28899/g.21520 Transcript_28899/m.21520 type:complete len:109 (-) Transcript_28899:1849-2175(-)
MEIAKDEEEAETYLEREKRKMAFKQLKQVNHEAESYDKLVKNLYIEAKEITKMSEKEINIFRKLNGDIKVRGLKCPRPISNWYQCGLSDGVLELLEKLGFEKPFPIQT